MDRFVAIVAWWDAVCFNPVRIAMDAHDKEMLSKIVFCSNPPAVEKFLENGCRPKVVVLDNNNGTGKDPADMVRKLSPETIILFHSIDNSHGLDRPDGAIDYNPYKRTEELVAKILTWPELPSATLETMKAAFPQVNWLR